MVVVAFGHDYPGNRGCPAKKQRDAPPEYGMQAQAKTAPTIYNNAMAQWQFISFFDLI